MRDEEGRRVHIYRVSGKEEKYYEVAMNKREDDCLVRRRSVEREGKVC